MTNNLENRQSFRVSESVYLKYEKLSDEEFKAGIEHRNLRLGINDGVLSKLVDIEARLTEAMFILNSENGALGRCITLLNDKLDIAISELPSLRESKASLAKLPPQTCDVGADGMVFSSSKPLVVGDKLHLRFLLSSDSRYAESFCEVMRLTDPPATESPSLKFGIAVRFVDLPPAQREILIQHMFTRESQTLRMRRLELESVEKLL